MKLQPGMKIGRWTLLERTEVSRKSKWLCACDCGTKKQVRQDHMKAALSRGCGCARAAASSKYNAILFAEGAV